MERLRQLVATHGNGSCVFEPLLGRTDLRAVVSDCNHGALSAAREVGVSRFVAQSFASMRNAREGGMVKSEDDPLDPDPPAKMRAASAAMRHLDQAVTGAGGIALRYGGFYGAANDGLIEPVRKRQFPIVGDGGGFFSFLHLDDAAAATVLALGRDGRRSTTSSTTSLPRCGNGCR
jgi:nucleoside-diphosphate-sugar epimerase